MAESAGVGEEISEVKFKVEGDAKEKQGVFFVGRENQTVKDAIFKESGDTVLSCPANEYIFWAHVKGMNELSDKVAINPNILLCGWLKQGTLIKTEKLPKSLNKSLQPMENMSYSVSDQTIFYISIDKAKSTRKITAIPAAKYRYKDMCVSAMKRESLLKALQKDGRFQNPENWRLLDSSTVVPLTTEACHLENKILTVEVETRKRTHGTDKTASESGTPFDVHKVKQEKIEEDECDSAVPSQYPTSTKDAPSILFETIVQAAKSTAEKNLLSKETRGTKVHTKLATLVEEKFSKSVDLSKSAWLVEQLASASKYVGRIAVDGGQKAGTCFLVTKDVILTNYHVYKDIKNDMASPHQKNPKVLVVFNYVRPNQVSGLDAVEVDIQDIVAYCPDEGLDYIFLRLKNECDNPPELNISTVNSAECTNGVVTIIGHPDDREKRVDTDCRVLSEHTWRSELLNRIQQPQPYDFKPLLTCKQKIMGDGYEYKIAYDTNFFHGASGSPVFDDQGRVIAMHTCGWVENADQGKRYVMEFAVTMEAIFEDCRKTNLSVAEELFPNMFMDTNKQD